VSLPFRAAEHIRRREDFERIYAAGARQSGRNMIIFFQPTAHAVPRLGIAATRKLGSAVVRNRAKRLVRELFRHNKPAGGLDLVVVPRREMLDAPYSSLEAEFRALLDRPVRPDRAAPVGGRPRRARAHSSL
jgi:ribonuclease P protein component